jgi:hypothetical protein
VFAIHEGVDQQSVVFDQLQLLFVICFRRPKRIPGSLDRVTNCSTVFICLILIWIQFTLSVIFVHDSSTYSVLILVNKFVHGGGHQRTSIWFARGLERGTFVVYFYFSKAKENCGCHFDCSIYLMNLCGEGKAVDVILTAVFIR